MLNIYWDTEESNLNNQDNKNKKAEKVLKKRAFRDK